MLKCIFDSRVIGGPEVLGKEAACEGNWVKIGRGGVVPEGPPSVEDAPT